MALTEADDGPNYIFTADWFSRKIPNFEKHLSIYENQPDIHYLELGVYEGRSLIWMLENILTHPSAKATCIDIFPRDLRQRFMNNLKMSGSEDKVTVIKGRFQVELRKLPFNAFDIIYIDGAHDAPDTIENAVLCWPLLKEGGLLIFDDYLWQQKARPAELRPQMAIDAFISIYRKYIEVIDR